MHAIFGRAITRQLPCLFSHLDSRVIRGDLVAIAITLFLSVSGVTAVMASYNEVIIFDSRSTDSNLREGLARQRLGLLDPAGKPLVDGSGILLPLISPDNLKAAFDMKLGAGTSFCSAFDQLRNSGGSLIINTHGNPGHIQLGSKTWADSGMGPMDRMAAPGSLIKSME